MKLTEEIKNKIYAEQADFRERLYAGKTLEERKALDQFFTPTELVIEMIEKMNCDSLEDKTILDPTCGSGNLLVACLIAGANYKNLYGNEYDYKMVKICRDRLRNVCESLGIESNGDENHKYEDFAIHIHRGNALQRVCLTEFNKLYNSEYDESRIDDLKYGQADFESFRTQQDAWDSMNTKEISMFDF